MSPKRRFVICFRWFICVDRRSTWSERFCYCYDLISALPCWPSAKAGWCGQYSLIADPHALVTQFFCKLMIVLWQSIAEKSFRWHTVKLLIMSWDSVPGRGCHLSLRYTCRIWVPFSLLPTVHPRVFESYHLLPSAKLFFASFSLLFLCSLTSR